MCMWARPRPLRSEPCQEARKTMAWRALYDRWHLELYITQAPPQMHRQYIVPSARAHKGPALLPPRCLLRGCRSRASSSSSTSTLVGDRRPVPSRSTPPHGSAQRMLLPCSAALGAPRNCTADLLMRPACSRQLVQGIDHPPGAGLCFQLFMLGYDSIHAVYCLAVMAHRRIARAASGHLMHGMNCLHDLFIAVPPYCHAPCAQPASTWCMAWTTRWSCTSCTSSRRASCPAARPAAASASRASCSS